MQRGNQQATQESNPDQEDWKLLCYHYTSSLHVMQLTMRKAPWDVPGASVVIDFRPYLGRVLARKE